MSIQKARAIMALPLGTRTDGKLVIACSEASREGIQNILKDIFGSEIYIVSTRPSVIFELLQRIDIQDKSNSFNSVEDNNNRLMKQITKEETDQFLAAFYRGVISHDLLLKASGLIDMSILPTPIPDEESLLAWLVNKNVLDAEYATLIKGLDRFINDMDRKARKSKSMPSLLDILQYSHYLTTDTVEWVKREFELLELTLEEFLYKNFLASFDTIKKANLLLYTLESILTNCF